MNVKTNDSNEELHRLLLELMIAFKNVCDKGTIWYSLAYGSLLGAVRHHGFIPWDTDADVVIMLPDKERFRETFRKYKPDGIALKDYNVEKRCLQSHDTLYFKDKQNYENVHLDIFPLVGAPSSPKEQARFAFLSCYVDKIIRSKYVDLRRCKKKNLPLVIGAKIVDALIPDHLLKRNIHSRETRFDFDKAEYLITLSNYGTANACIPKSVWNETILLSFEGIEFRVPRDWDTCLKRLYGQDYMMPKRY